MKTQKQTISLKLKPRGRVFELFSKEENYLDSKNGDIFPVKQVRENKEVIIGYVQKFKSITGYIDDVTIQKRFVKRGDAKVKQDIINIFMDSGGEKVTIEFSFDGGYGRSFSKTFKNINLSKEVTISPWQMEPEKGQKYGPSGLVFHSDESKQNKIKPYWTRDNSPIFDVKSRGEVKFDKEAFSDWLYEETVKYVYKKFEHYEEKPEEERHDDDYDDRKRSSDRDDRDAPRDSDRSRGRDDDRRPNRDDRSERPDDRSSRNGRSGDSDERSERSRGDEERRSTRDDRDERPRSEERPEREYRKRDTDDERRPSSPRDEEGPSFSDDDDDLPF